MDSGREGGGGREETDLEQKFNVSRNLDPSRMGGDEAEDRVVCWHPLLKGKAESRHDLEH